LGNLYAAQFVAQAEADLGVFDQAFARGHFAGLLDWLRTNIHRRGQCYSAAELVQLVTGQPLSHDPLLSYLRRKYGELYGIAE
jgi:carboxypeptidase Taq